MLYPITQLHPHRDFRRKHRDRCRLFKHLERFGDKTVIIVAGYEKSGNSWLCRLMAEALGCPSTGLAGDLKGRMTEVATEGLDRTIRSDFVVLKSHNPFSDFSGLNPVRTKLVTIIRDPRDIVVSGKHYYYYGKPGGDEKTLIRMRGNRHRPGWPVYVREFARNDVPFVRYEDLLGATEQNLRRLFQELCLDCEPARIKGAVHQQSFGVARARYRQKGETE